MMPQMIMMSRVEYTVINIIGDHAFMLSKKSYNFAKARPTQMIFITTRYHQWRIQDLKEGGARSIARKASSQILRPQDVDHTPHLRVLLRKKAVLGLAVMRKCHYRSEF